MHDHDDFDFEHMPGVPAPLPPGEQIVWQGKPDTWSVAKHAFHLRKVAVYFLLLLAVQMISMLDAGAQGHEPFISLNTTVFLSAVGLSILGLLAWLTARVTIYTVTNRRILIRFGIALQITINLPFSQIMAADMRVHNHGFGDIPLLLKDSTRVNYFVLWPHVRPWCFSKPQPMLRCIPDVERVAGIIASVAAQTSELHSARPASTSRTGAGTPVNAELVRSKA